MNLFGIPDSTWTGAGVTTLGLALAGLVLFVRGVITLGKYLDRLEAANAELRGGLRELAAAVQRKNDIDEARDHAVELERARSGRDRG